MITGKKIKSTNMALRTLLRFTLRVAGSTGISWILIPKYAAPLSNEACAVTGTILGDPVNPDWASNTQRVTTHISGSVMPLTSLAQSL